VGLFDLPEQLPVLGPGAKSWEKAGRSKAETLSLFQSTIKSPFFDQENGITHMGP